MSGTDDTAHATGLTPDPQEVVDALANPPGQPALRRRVAPHAISLARMRNRLASPAHDLAVRSLARAGADDPAVALLDAWAVVADTVSFYSERIATEGFLRTAVQHGSVRELARTLGHDLRPGVSAEVDLAFTAETAGEPPDVVVVPGGTPVQSVPGPGALPQTFETTDELEVRRVWNAVPVVATMTQHIQPGGNRLWVRGMTTLRAGDAVLLVLRGVTLRWVGVGDPFDPAVLDQLGPLRGIRTFRRSGRTDLLLIADRRHFGRWVAQEVTSRHLLTIASADAGVGATAGWTLLTFDRAPFLARGEDGGRNLARTVLAAYTFRERLRIFGWNAPDPNLLVIDGHPPAGSSKDDGASAYHWVGFDLTLPLDLDGEHPAVLAGSRVVLEQAGTTVPCVVGTVQRDGRSKFALNGPVTSVGLTKDGGSPAPGAPTLTGLDRRGLAVHAVSTALDATQMPDGTPLTGTTVLVATTDPPIPVGRRVILAGTDPTGAPVAVAADVVGSEPVRVTAPDGTTADTGTTAITLSARPPALSRSGLVVLANVARSTHGETATQVLGSGDGRTPFPSFVLRRPPLTHVRATTPGGARAALVVRVDGVEWTQVGSLLDAGPRDRVYVVRRDEDGGARVVFGDGVHGARPATGTENITAVYRTGIGADGAVPARTVTLLVRRPLGIREVTNPLPSTGWAAPETLEEARTGAPLLVRTLDRAVSVADHEDLARGYAGVGPARADLLWDGSVRRVIVSVLGTGGLDPGDGLVTGLRAALDAARDPSALLDVRAGEQLWFGVRVEVAHDPARVRDEVLTGVRATLAAAFGPGARQFAAPVTAGAVLVAVRSAPGVTACTVPRLFPLVSPPAAGTTASLPADAAGLDPLRALPGRWDGGVRPAQLLALAGGAVEIREMTR